MKEEEEMEESEEGEALTSFPEQRLTSKRHVVPKVQVSTVTSSAQHLTDSAL